MQVKQRTQCNGCNTTNASYETNAMQALQCNGRNATDAMDPTQDFCLCVLAIMLLASAVSVAYLFSYCLAFVACVACVALDGNQAL